MHRSSKIITRLTFALNSAVRSVPSFFSSAVAAGSLPQIIGAFMTKVGHNQNQKHRRRGKTHSSIISPESFLELGCLVMVLLSIKKCYTYYRLLFDNPLTLFFLMYGKSWNISEGLFWEICVVVYYLFSIQICVSREDHINQGILN